MLQAIDPIIGDRYQIIQEIGQGGMSIVYLTFDRLTRQNVALKRIKPVEEHPLQDTTTDYRLAIANEFRLLASLNHPNVVSVFDYGFDGTGQPYFTMELLSDSQSIFDVANNNGEEVWYDLIIQLIHAVIYLHRRGIIHRDLKPDNIRVIVDEHGKYRVKLVDFGIANTVGVLDTKQDALAGSFAYMAPEILKGLNYSEQSDIYALGLIIYEIFTGYYAFPHQNMSSLVQSILSAKLDFDIPEIDPMLAPILEQATAIDLDIRYTSAADLLISMQSVLQLPTQDTLEIRESYLQAARFIGREHELTILNNALTQALGGQGSFWLIGGESGVGKSRLIDEIRTKSLTQGCLVLHGQALEGGHKLYAMWQDVLRRLLLAVDVGDFQARVLKQVVPDIEQLLNRNMTTAPQLAGHEQRIRLATTVVEMFQQLDKPVLLILEDIHWVVEDLFLLKQLSYVVSQMNMLILANYRSDIRPDMPEQFANHYHLMQLETFSRDDVKELCRAMLGDVTIDAHVLDMMWEESAGNVFILLTLIRALTDDNQDLSQLNNIALTSETVSSGIHALINNRIMHLPDDSQRILSTASVFGSQISLSVLNAIHPKMNNEHWLLQCSNVGLIERHDDGSWQFAHDRYREAIRSMITDSEFNQLSRQIAETIERIYPHDPTQDAILAFHWHNAQNNTKEFTYCLRASRQMIAGGSYREGLQIALRAEELVAAVGANDDTRSKVAHMIGDAYYGLGNITECNQYLQEALHLIGMPDATANGNLMRGFIKQMLIQLWHRMKPDRFNVRQQYVERREHWLRMLAIYEKLQQLAYFRNQAVSAFYCVLIALNISERLGQDALHWKARNSASMTVAFGAIKLPVVADMYVRRVKHMMNHDTIDHLSASIVKYYLGVYSSGQSRWEEAIFHYMDMMQYATQAGLTRHLEETKMLLAGTLFIVGDMPDALAHANDVYEIASRQHDTQFVALASATQAEIYLRRGEHEIAQQLLESALSVLDKLGDTGAVARVCGLLARLHVRLNELEQAQGYAERVEELLTDGIGVRFGILEGLIGAAELWLGLWQKDMQNNDYQRRAHVACQRLEAFANRYKSGKPMALILRARYLGLQGNSRQAQNTLEKAKSVSHDLQMPYEDALASFYQGWLITENSQLRQQKLKRALAIFEQLGTQWDVERATILLAHPE